MLGNRNHNASTTSQQQPQQQSCLTFILQRYYNQCWQRLLGDIQLSFILFLHFQCFASLEHWRDLIAMLSFVTPTTVDENREFTTDLFVHLITILLQQMKFMDQDFWEDEEFSGDNFMAPAMARLIKTLQCCQEERVRQSAMELQMAVFKLFPSWSCIDMEWKNTTSFIPKDTIVNDCGVDHHQQQQQQDKEEEEEDSDGPVLVPFEEYEAARVRGSLPIHPTINYNNNPGDPSRETCKELLQMKYPILLASMQPHEDLLMVCARALDTQVDVSLVREAAAYLEEVEAHRVTTQE